MKIFPDLWIDPIMDQSMDVPPHPIIGKGKNGRFFSETSTTTTRYRYCSFNDLWNPLRKNPTKKKGWRLCLEVQLPCWSQPLAPMGPGKFFSPRGGAAGWEELFSLAREGFLHRKPDPILGELPSSKDRVSIGLFRYTWLCLKIKGASKITGSLWKWHLSGSPFKGFVSLRQALNQRFACVLCCCYGKLKIMINLDWDLPNSTEHFMIPKPTLAIQQWNHPET